MFYTNAVNNVETFTYDAAGNILEAQSGGNTDTFVYEDDNRLAEWNGQKYWTSVKGNISSHMHEGKSVSVDYDKKDRIKQIDGDWNEYWYDADGNRINMYYYHTNMKYAYDCSGGRHRLLWTSDHLEQDTTYGYGADGLLWSVCGGEYRFYHYDYRGSVVAVTDMDGNITDTRLPQYENASLPIVLIPSEIVTDVRPVHFENALSAIAVMLPGIITDESPLQPENALLPTVLTLLDTGSSVSPVLRNALSQISVTLSGNSMPVSAKQSSNIFGAMEVTPSAIFTVLRLLQFEKILFPHISTLPGIFTDVRSLQFAYALPSTILTLSGIVIVLREEHQANAPSPIAVTPSGIATDDRLAHP